MQAIQKMFSVFDSKAQCFKSLYNADTTGVGVRNFESAVKDKNTELNKYPDDFVLFEIGTWNVITGEILGLDHPINLGTARQVLGDSE